MPFTPEAGQQGPPGSFPPTAQPPPSQASMHGQVETANPTANVNLAELDVAQLRAMSAEDRSFAMMMMLIEQKREIEKMKEERSSSKATRRATQQNSQGEVEGVLGGVPTTFGQVDVKQWQRNLSHADKPPLTSRPPTGPIQPQPQYAPGVQQRAAKVISGPERLEYTREERQRLPNREAPPREYWRQEPQHTGGASARPATGTEHGTRTAAQQPVPPTPQITHNPQQVQFQFLDDQGRQHIFSGTQVVTENEMQFRPPPRMPTAATHITPQTPAAQISTAYRDPPTPPYEADAHRTREPQTAYQHELMVNTSRPHIPEAYSLPPLGHRQTGLRPESRTPKAAEAIPGRSFDIALHTKKSRRYEFVYQSKDLPKFKGWKDGKHVLNFIRAMDNRLLKVPDEEITTRPAVMFEGSALKWYENLSTHELMELNTWEQWRQKLKETFLSTEHMMMVQTASVNKIIREGEDIREYFNAKQSLLRTAFPEMSDASIGSLILAGCPAEWRASLQWNPKYHTLVNLQHMMEQHAPQLSMMWWKEHIDHRRTSGLPTDDYYTKLEDLDSTSLAQAPVKTKKPKDAKPAEPTTPSPNPKQLKPPSDPEWWLRGQRNRLKREPAFAEPPLHPCGLCGKGYHHQQDCDLVVSGRAVPGKPYKHLNHYSGEPKSNPNNTPIGNHQNNQFRNQGQPGQNPQQP